MQKTIDGIAVRFSIFLLLLIWLDYFIGNFFGALTLSFLLTLLFAMIVSKVAEKRKAFKYDKNRFYNLLILLGGDYVLSLYDKAAPENDDYVYAAFRYSALTPDDVAAAFRKAASDGKEKIKIICNTASRGVRVFAASLPKTVEVIDATAFYKLLKTANELPTLIEVKKPKVKFNLKAAFSSALSENNVKYYLFTAVVTALMIYVTPLKIYYVVFSTISLILALLCKIVRQ